jgi:hypothetical protein
MKTKSQKNTVQSFTKQSLYLGMFLLSIFLFTSCNEEDPEVVNEDEVITTVIIALKTNSQSILLKSIDLDGYGPIDPVVAVSGPLTKNTVYTGTVSFLNELVNPAENISDEVLAEAEQHQVFYQAPAVFGTFAYDDTDANGKPLGLKFTFTTGSSTIAGNLTVILIHELNKSNPGVSDGSITNAGGSTDAEVFFPIQIQ